VKQFLIAAAVLTAAALTPGIAAAKPCSKHTNETKVSKAQCLKHHERIKKRDRMAWPPDPTVAEIRARVDRIGGNGTYEKAWRIAVCETGGNPRHFPYGKFRGMMGMYVTTYQYGQRKTSYPNPDTATPQQQIAIAVASWEITQGWSGWGCSSA
jgi:hypothetical protein